MYFIIVIVIIIIIIIIHIGGGQEWLISIPVVDMITQGIGGIIQRID